MTQGKHVDTIALHLAALLHGEELPHPDSAQVTALLSSIRHMLNSELTERK